MHTLQGDDLQKAINLFERYNSNQSVIFCIFERQFDGCAYVDDIDAMNWAVLKTPFLQHFIAGSPTDGCAKELENIIFGIILQEQTEKEIVLFSDTDAWAGVLREVFQAYNGVTDFRKIFDFSPENYRDAQRPGLPGGAKPLLEKCKTLPLSHRDAWSARLMVEGRTASYCNAIMMGRGKAEIDIYADEAFRGKGYATTAAFTLIDKLLEEGITPTWSAWPFRVESRHIAKKLGFVSAPDAKAWIWQEGM